MKRVLFLLFLLNVLVVKGQDVVTNFTSNGNIEVDSSYIDPFNQGLGLDFYKNLDPSILKDELTITTPSGLIYTVKAFRFKGKGWEGEPGDYNVVKVYKDGHEIYDMLCIMGWNYFPQKLTGESESHCCYPVNVTDDIVALVFHGIYINNQAPQIAIVVLKGTQAKLVFNEEFRIRELKKTNEGVKFVLQENLVQYNSEGIPDSEPILKTLSISKDCISINAQNTVFSCGDANNIVTNSSYISTFDNGEFDNISSHTLFKDYTVTSKAGTEYIIKCYKNTAWEDEPGDWHYFEILNNGEVIFSEDYADGWIFLSDVLASSLTSESNAFLKFDLDNNTVLLLFEGSTIMSQPPFLTGVILRDGKATLVYNKTGYIEQVVQSSSETVFTICENTVEYDANDNPFSTPIIKTLTIKNGMMYYK